MKKNFTFLLLIIFLLPFFTFAQTSTTTSTTTEETLTEETETLIFPFSEEGAPEILKASAGEVIIILQLFLLYITILSFGLIYFLWGGKLNKTGSQMFQQNTDEGKKSYYD